MVDPAQKNFLRRHLHQVSQSLVVPQEVDQPRDLADGDLLEEIHLDELPDQAQHQPLLALAGVQGVTVDPDDNTANSLGGVDGQRQVLVLLGEVRGSDY